MKRLAVFVFAAILLTSAAYGQWGAGGAWGGIASQWNSTVKDSISKYFVELNGDTATGIYLWQYTAPTTPMADGTRIFSSVVTGSTSAASGAEVTGSYHAYNWTKGDNANNTYNALEGVFRSQKADESITGRGVYGRVYVDPTVPTTTLRTGVGGEFSYRASYSGGAEIAAEAGTAAVGARIWMAPYFSAATVANVNNFHGLWIYGEHATQKNATNGIYLNDAGGGFTNGINLAASKYAGNILTTTGALASVSSGTSTAYSLGYTVNNSGTAGAIGLQIRPTITANGSGGHKILNVYGTVSIPNLFTVYDTTAASTSGATFAGYAGQSSGEYTGLSITPTITQSGTAGFVGLNVEPVETSVGSGTKKIVRFGYDTDQLYQLLSDGTTNSLSSLTGSSGTSIAAEIHPTVNQSGTAGYTGLRIGVTETATGSGNKRFINCGTYSGSTLTDKFYVNNSGYSFVGAGTSTTPGMSFVDFTSTGFYAPSNGQIVATMNTTPVTNWTSSGLFAGVGGTGRAFLPITAASATVPVHSYADDTNSGLGLGAADSPSLIGGGAELIRASGAVAGDPTVTLFPVSANKFSATADSAYGSNGFMSRAQSIRTADATPVKIYESDALSDGDVVTIECLVKASDANGDTTAVYKLIADVSRVGTTTALLGSIGTLYSRETDAGFDCTIAANDTDEKYYIQVTGLDRSIVWIAKIESTRINTP